MSRARLGWLTQWWSKRPRSLVLARAGVSVGSLSAILVACQDASSATDLNPDGPPMVRQLFVREAYLDENNIRRVTRRIAFGTHPDAAPEDVKAVTAAIADSNQSLRVVVDELLVGNFLEEIACRGPVDDDAYTQVPVGATPDDIAACAVALDILPESCVGEYAVCLGQDGAPVGVLDEDEDGTSDDTRFIRGSVRLVCDGIDVPINIDASYWQPSGTQLPPAQGGIDVIGPAVVLKPELGLPTNSTCAVVFANTVVDKTNIQVCAPADGDITKDCTPGDTSAATFGTEPLFLVTSFPADGATNVPLVTAGQTYSQVRITFQVPVDEATLLNATIDPPLAAFSVQPGLDTTQWNLRFPGGYAANTTYTLTLPTTVTDRFEKGLPAPIELSFTTAP